MGGRATLQHEQLNATELRDEFGFVGGDVKRIERYRKATGVGVHDTCPLPRVGPGRGTPPNILSIRGGGTWWVGVRGVRRWYGFEGVQQQKKLLRKPW